MQSAEVARRCLDWFGPGQPSLTPTGLVSEGPLASFLSSRIDPLDIEGGSVRQVATMQRCLRPDDMRIVGRTGHHGTFFQMVTALSLGSDVTPDLAKAAWLLTTAAVTDGGLGIPAHRLRILAPSDEGAAIWSATAGVDDGVVVRRDPADRPGAGDDPGAVNVLSDIVLDRGTDADRETPDRLGGVRTLKLWSLQRSRHGSATAVGFGVERIAMASQGVVTFSDTDQVRPVLDRLTELTGTAYDDTDPGSVAGVRLRVAADHVRTALMLADAGVTTEDDRHGVILLRVVRRTILALRLLGLDAPAFADLLPVARDLMAPTYPSVAEHYDQIETALVGTELALRGTLPARTSDPAPTGTSVELALLEDLRATSGASYSLAYQTLRSSVRVVAILADDARIDTAEADVTVDVVLDRTPFFAETCGQAGDQGTLSGEGVSAHVTATRWGVPELVVHRVRVETGVLQVGAELTAQVDAEQRVASCQAHSATHVLQAALREHLGPTAVRTTSWDSPGNVALEIDGTLPWSDETARAVEDIANDALRSDWTVKARVMTDGEAAAAGVFDAHGAHAADLAAELGTVRVVEIGGTFSREVCDGTHVLHTSQIGLITLTRSRITDTGRRRIEAMCGIEGFRRLARDRDVVNDLARTVGVSREQLLARVEQLVSLDAGEATVDLAAAERGFLADADAAAAAATSVAGASYAETRTSQPWQARKLAELVRDRLDPSRPGVVVVTGGDGSQRSVVVSVNEPGVAAGLLAHELIRSGLDRDSDGIAELAEGPIESDEQQSAIARIRMKIGVVTGSLAD
jgi:alanyl-tRNA synthetase